MAITEADIDKLARLAQLELTDDERRRLAPQINSIVAYVDQLNELDTSAIEPVLGGFTPEGERTHAAREDVPHRSLGQQLALSEAPDPAEGHFRVPKVL